MKKKLLLTLLAAVMLVYSAVSVASARPDEEQTSGVPDYHKSAVSEKAGQIKSLINDDSIVFGAISDCHVRTGGKFESETKLSASRAAYALESIGSDIGMDFVINLGDNQWENNIDTDNALNSMNYLNSCIKGVFDDNISFRIPGNHDQSSTFGKIYDYVGVYNSFDSSAATAQRGYGYKDFEAKKLRVICLNTSDYYNKKGGYGMSYEQKQFLMSALDLSAKQAPSDWNIIIMSHFPLDYPKCDYNTVNDIQAILNAYTNGGAVSITVDPLYASAENERIRGKLTYNYRGRNSAEIICNIHGHIHNHCYGNMADNGIVRICAPNTCFMLEKSTFGTGDGMYDFSPAYHKILDSVYETAVTFFVIDTSKKEINALVYGAGVDRFISYGKDNQSEPTAEPGGGVLYGDVNGDGAVDVTDAVMIQKYVVEKQDLTPEQLVAADYDRDGGVDILDATAIQKYSASN